MDEELNIILRKINYFGTEKTYGYLKKPFLCDIDYDIFKIIDIFYKLSVNDRRNISQHINKDHSGTLLAFSKRMAIFSVRQYLDAYISYGLMAQVIEDLKVDARENIIDLCLLYHSAKKINANPDKLFEKAGTYASEEMAKFLKNYIEKGFKNIESMGYKEEMTPDGFIYRRFEKPFPSDWLKLRQQGKGQ